MTGFWLGAAIGMFSGTISGVLLTCIFASSRVTQAEAEAARWREIAGDKQRLRVTWDAGVRR